MGGTICAKMGLSDLVLEKIESWHKLLAFNTRSKGGHGNFHKRFDLHCVPKATHQKLVLI
jgi:hypothetical protein